jgi:hypothetical protein
VKRLCLTHDLFDALPVAEKALGYLQFPRVPDSFLLPTANREFWNDAVSFGLRVAGPLIERAEVIAIEQVFLTPSEDARCPESRRQYPELIRIRCIY